MGRSRDRSGSCGGGSGWAAVVFAECTDPGYDSDTCQLVAYGFAIVGAGIGAVLSVVLFVFVKATRLSAVFVMFVGITLVVFSGVHRRDNRICLHGGLGRNTTIFGCSICRTRCGRSPGRGRSSIRSHTPSSNPLLIPWSNPWTHASRRGVAAVVGKPEKVGISFSETEPL